MKVRFWGTRGSLAKPGPDTVRYGGNTSCIEVESASGTLLLIDCGTGAHALGQQLIRDRPPPLCGHILISHTHWDHIQGIPFFAPLFVAGNEWHFYAAQGFGESLRETLSGQMEYTYFPVTLDALTATVSYHHLAEGVFQIGDITVRTRYLNHPALTLGYRLEADGASVVYACDHEPHSRQMAVECVEPIGEDRQHAEFLRGADLVIHDAQYTAAEYPDKVGWGHSTVEYAVNVCASVGVKRLALTHHDPLRVDTAIDRLIEDLHERFAAQARCMQIFAAAEGRCFELTGAGSAADASRFENLPSAMLDGRAEQAKAVLLVGTSAAIEEVATAIVADPLEVCRAAGAMHGLAVLRQRAVDLVISDGHLVDMSGTDFAQAVAAISSAELAAPSVILVTSEAVDNSAEGAVKDYLQTPFSHEYARSRVRAWLLRAPCHWQLPALPANEAQRLAALHDLQILDTPQEERFDRYVRLASAVLNAPIALISLVDAERQWFKSCVGAEPGESPRESSFCAHAIHQSDLFIVPDTLLDQRFADNPAVVAGPRVRFYAGRPLFLDDGACIGTLCVVDRRPRELNAMQKRLLDDLGGLVEQELRR